MKEFNFKLIPRVIWTAILLAIWCFIPTIVLVGFFRANYQLDITKLMIVVCVLLSVFYLIPTIVKNDDNYEKFKTVSSYVYGAALLLGGTVKVIGMLVDKIPQ
jgi:amino acid permease